MSELGQIKPMLCKLLPKVLDEPDWYWERKYDGARILAQVQDSKYELVSRTGKDKSELFPELELHTRKPAILDGEIVPLDETVGFAGIQTRINRAYDLDWASKECPTKYMVFDVLAVDGRNVESLPFLERRNLLLDVLIPSENVLVSSISTDGRSLLEQAAKEKWEGIVGKNAAEVYRRNKRSWVKIKTWQTGVFFAYGYTKGTGRRDDSFGSLVLVDTESRYVGAVGTGFDDDMLKVLTNSFSEAPCPFSEAPVSAKWIKPFLVVVQYLEYTNDGLLRFPSFVGLAQ